MVLGGDADNREAHFADRVRRRRACLGKDALVGGVRRGPTVPEVNVLSPSRFGHRTARFHLISLGSTHGTTKDHAEDRLELEK